MEQNTNQELEIDLREIYFVLKHKIWFILLIGVLAVTASGLFTEFTITPMYTSVSKLYVVSKSTTITSLTDLELGTQLTQDYMVMIKSRPVTEKVIENLDLDMTHEELVNYVTVTNPSDTRILEIAVENPDPYLAKTIANEFASVSATRMAKIMDTQEPNIVESAYLPDSPSSPSLMKNMALAGFVGVFLSCVAIVLIYILNESIVSEDDVEKYLGLSVLGVIPVAQGQRKKKKVFKARKRGK